MPIRPVRRVSRRTGRSYIAGYRIGRGKAIYRRKSTAERVQVAIKARTRGR